MGEESHRESDQVSDYFLIYPFLIMRLMTSLLNIRYEIPDESYVGIVTYASRAVVTHGLSQVSREAARQ